MSARSCLRKYRRGKTGFMRRAAAGVALVLLGSMTTIVDPATGNAEPACTSEQPDEASASAMAVRCNQQVEVVSGRTESSQVFAQPSGTFSWESATVPTRVHEDDGSWVPVDTNLKPDTDGRLTPTASTADVSFSDGGTGPLVDLISGTHHFTVSWPDGSLPAPTVSGDSAIYAEVLPGVDLRVTATADGFRHDVVVKTPEAAANPAVKTVKYVLGGDAVASETALGGVSASAGGRVMAVAGGAVMWDSGSTSSAALAGSVKPALAGPGDGAQQADVDTQIVGSELQLTPDPALLSDPNAVYPLVVDPAYSTGMSSWAYANNTNSDWGVDDAWVGVNPADYGGDGRLYRSFFRFPTTSGSVSIKGKYIESAKVTMNLHHSYSCTATPVSAYRTSAITGWPRSKWSSMVLQKYLDTASGHANKDACPQPDTSMQFTGNLRSDLQYGVSHNWVSYTVGLVANDSSHTGETIADRWKTFTPSDAKLIVDYDSYPGRPGSCPPPGWRAARGGCRWARRRRR